MTTVMDAESNRVQAAIKQIAPTIEQHQAEGEQGRRPPEAIVSALRNADLLKLWTPKEYGGSEVDLPVFMEAVESLARIDSSTGWIFSTGAAGGLLTAFMPPENAKEVVLPKQPRLFHLSDWCHRR